MPSPMVDQRGVSASSHFFDDISFRSERDAGIRKFKSIHDQYPQGKNGMIASPGSNLNSSSVLERSAKSGLPMSCTSLSIENVEQLKFGGEGIFDALMVSKESSHYHHRSRSDVCMRSGPNSPGVIGDKFVSSAATCESTLFSSSLSDMFCQKLRLFGKDALSDQPDIIDSVPEEEPYKSLEEIEAETIGNLLPDEDDLFSGVNDESRYNNTNARKNDDLEDFDLFSSGGGMELERDEHLNAGLRTSALEGDSGFVGGPKGKFPFVTQPSRTLFVRNINSNVDDSELKALFEVNASEKDIGHGTLMLSGLDSSISNDELKQIFGFYGDIKEIFESPEMKQHKFIEFYDVRAAEAALRALNRIDIAGKQIKIEPGHPSLMQQSHKGQDEPDLGQSIIDNLALRQKATVSAGVIGSGLENGYNQGFQSGMAQPLNTYNDNAFGHINSSIHNTVRGSSASNVSGVSESNIFVDAIKFASSPRFHPHSLPEYHDTLANGSPYNFSSTISNMTSSVNTGVTEASDSRHIQGMGSTGNLAEFNAGGNGIRSHHGLYQMWNSSNLHQQSSSGTMLWQKRPSFVNLPQMPSFAITPPHMLRSQHMDHNVASAPVSPWGRQHSHLAESPDASGFVGSGGFQGSWQLLSPEFSPRLFPHASPKGTELPSNAGQSSPKHHGFPGRHSMNSTSKIDSANERMRSLYHRRSETNNADKKQFELDLGRIMQGEDTRTTLMIKNIPNKYTSKMLLAAIDERCRGTYDFLYLPIDFKNKCNVGYAFINMIDAAQIIPFHQTFNGKKWEKFNSEKVASLAYARIQGKASLIAHFQNSSLMNEDKRCRPILFHTDGPNAGDPEPFPMGTNIRVRPGKSRTAGNDESRNQPSPRILINVESPNGLDSA
ncbi:protein MEI2-like 4 isoform X2 [Arachis hypogaea]|uniref:protein MEI2-like 4 isoform X2 n=1 Tax=Arachis hypogaea TaxID=3818 RepID=UPI000DEC2BC5|nr:protein MEI2-like 4 isoform X2 [Arachis hypogaea]QHO02242.1 Protein MEI2-like [Arachis hypogaea]